jgi:methyltransferase (TIGR00027 family)
MGRPPAAQTAIGPMVIAAVEQLQPADRRVVTDPLAVRFLPRVIGMLVRACRWGWWRRKVVALTDGKAPGLWAEMVCRKRYLDDQVRAALDAGIGQLLVLGAGFDTRGYRLAEPPVTVYEIDLPANVATKRARVTAVLGAVPGHVRLVPVDLGTEDLAESLRANGFRFDEPVMVVWEAVTQYLTEAAVRRTLALLGTTAPGSRLAVTFVRQDFLDGTNTYQADGLYQSFVRERRIWLFGQHPDQVASLLAEHGWTEREQLGGAELRQRYLDPVGRGQPVSELERIVTAERA